METLTLTKPETDNNAHPQHKDIPEDQARSEEVDSEIYLEADDFLPKEKDSILKKPIQKAKGKKKYHNISNEMRLRLIDLVEKQGTKIKHAAKKLGINYSSAKSICQIFKREGRTNKKVFKKNFENDESTPDNEEFSLSQFSSKEESEASSAKAGHENQAKPAQDTTHVKKLDFPPKTSDNQRIIAKPEVPEQPFIKIEKQIMVPTMDLLKASNPIQSFTNAINQAKTDNISPNKISLTKTLTNPQLGSAPIYYKPNQNMYSYSPSTGPIIIQQSNYAPYQNLNYSTPGFMRQMTNPQNQLSEQLNIFQSQQPQAQNSDSMYQTSQMLPQGPFVVMGNNFPQQMNTPYIIASSPNMIGGQQMGQLGGYQIVQPLICVMPQQQGMMMGYQQNVMQDQNVIIQSQQVQQQVQPQQSNFGINSMYQNYGFGKTNPNIQYILMKNGEDQQLLQKK